MPPVKPPLHALCTEDLGFTAQERNPNRQRRQRQELTEANPNPITLILVQPEPFSPLQELTEADAAQCAELTLRRIAELTHLTECELGLLTLILTLPPNPNPHPHQVRRAHPPFRVGLRPRAGRGDPAGARHLPDPNPNPPTLTLQDLSTSLTLTLTLTLTLQDLGTSG